jgi:hypothetical protein
LERLDLNFGKSKSNTVFGLTGGDSKGGVSRLAVSVNKLVPCYALSPVRCIKFFFPLTTEETQDTGTLY